MKTFFQAVLWGLLFIPSLLITAACMILAPVVALPCFVIMEPRTDRVKRLGNQTLTFKREYLVTWLRWFQTHDNAVDEYWWGKFTDSSIFGYVKDSEQIDYDTSAYLRYVCRVLWLWRNPAYGFAYHLLSMPLDAVTNTYETGDPDVGYWHEVIIRESSWQIKAKIPVSAKFFISINFGWKTHTGFDRCMYASRIFGTGSR